VLKKCDFHKSHPTRFNEQTHSEVSNQKHENKITVAALFYRIIFPYILRIFLPLSQQGKKIWADTYEVEYKLPFVTSRTLLTTKEIYHQKRTADKMKVFEEILWRGVEQKHFFLLMFFWGKIYFRDSNCKKYISVITSLNKYSTSSVGQSR